jgi:hypothetical protein
MNARRQAAISIRNICFFMNFNCCGVQFSLCPLYQVFTRHFGVEGTNTSKRTSFIWFLKLNSKRLIRSKPFYLSLLNLKAPTTGDPFSYLKSMHKTHIHQMLPHLCSDRACSIPGRRHRPTASVYPRSCGREYCIKGTRWLCIGSTLCEFARWVIGSSLPFSFLNS